MSWDEGKQRKLGRLWGGDPGEEMGVVRGLVGGVGGVGRVRTVLPHGPRDAPTQGPGSDLNEPS